MLGESRAAAAAAARVLKPPGGGSSDIFGIGGGEVQQSPRKMKPGMVSNISLTDGPVAPSGTGPGSTSSAASSTSGETPSPGSPTGSPTRNGTAQTGSQQHAQQQVSGEVAAAGKAPDGEPRGRQFQMESHFSLGYDKAASPVKGEAAQQAPASLEASLAGTPGTPSYPFPFRYHFPCRRSLRRPDGNPVTGEGYKPQGGAAPIRNRVPPGGYSSGLW
ncbi:Microtubule-associated protein Jupiter [Frankliniella fusca]|uniref:Microtubule-associated protein Jupiter n=1 Tax=Frankliniella fusca TaxID=407009 RepID=A0AAE1H5T2_9NEOP|nr:Microtubule-associated protein Jupiter [Frankliniella fusca]